MNEILDDFMTEGERIPEFPFDPNIVNSGNYWWKILTDSRGAFGFILSEKPLKSTVVLYLLTMSASFLESSGLDEIFPSLALIYKNEVSRILFEFCFVSFITLFCIVLLYFIGRRLGGTGHLLDVGMTYIWSFAPGLLSYPLMLYLFFVTPESNGLENFMQNPYTTINTVLIYINTLLGIWGLILSFRGLSIAHQFSGRKAVYAYMILFGVIISIGVFFFIFLDLI